MSAGNSMKIGMPSRRKWPSTEAAGKRAALFWRSCQSSGGKYCNGTHLGRASTLVACTQSSTCKQQHCRCDKSSRHWVVVRRTCGHFDNSHKTSHSDCLNKKNVENSDLCNINVGLQHPKWAGRGHGWAGGGDSDAPKAVIRKLMMTHFTDSS